MYVCTWSVDHIAIHGKCFLYPGSLGMPYHSPSLFLAPSPLERATFHSGTDCSAGHRHALAFALFVCAHIRTWASCRLSMATDDSLFF